MAHTPNRILVSLFAASLFLASACSTPRARTARGAASADPTQACVPPSDPNATFERYVDSLVAGGIWTADERTAALGWKEEDRRNSVIYAIVGAYAYGNTLMHGFDQAIRGGATVERMISGGKATAKQKSQRRIYAKLLVLREVKEELLHLGINLLLQDLAAYRRPDWSKERQAQAIAVFLRNYKETAERLVAGSGNSNRDFLKLALDELSAVGDDLYAYARSCDPREFGATAYKRQAETAAAARAFPPSKGLGVYKLFEPRADRPGISVVKIVDTLSQRDLSSVDPRDGRSPQSDACGPPWYPEPKVCGNIVGTAFPKGAWALTFDDGPAKTTPQVLDNLKKHDMKATFFMLSQQIVPDMYPEFALRERDEGHAIASHSYTHAKIPSLDEAGRKHEILDAVDVFKDVMGTKPEYFRLPYGAGVSVAAVREMIAGAGMIHVFWNVDTLDWQDKDPDVIYERALTQMKNLGRGVILFHDIHPQSVVASEKVMGYLKDPANKLCPVTIPDAVKNLNAVERGENVPSLCN